jgi:hypothetical protein
METNNLLSTQPPKSSWFLNPKVLYSVIGVLLLVLILGLVYWPRIEKEPTVNQPEERTNINQTTNQNPSEEWNTYQDEKYKFSITYPRNDVEIQDDLGYRVVTIKNFDLGRSTTYRRMLADEFYIDIYIAEREHEKTPCTTDLKNITESKINNVTIYRGTTEYSMIQDGVQSTLCLQDPGRNIRIIVVEAKDKTNLIAPRVLDSFKFTN